MLFTHTFKGIGTHWSITVKNTTEPKNLWCLIDEEVKNFENRFSRFKPDSLVNQFKDAKAGSYDIDPELAHLLSFAQDLKKNSNDKFDPAISQLLSLTGYDSAYSFKSKDQQIDKWTRPQWSINGTTLTTNGPITFDLGGFAKGYLIDKIANIIKKHKYSYFLVDGGGDMYGSQKDKDNPWQIAIENPQDNTQYICTVPLDHCALAVSDIFKRRWQNHNHILDPDKKSSQQTIIACSVVAPNAITADGLTTCLMLNHQNNWKTIADRYQAHYQIITSDHQIIVNQSWPGVFAA